MPSGVILTSASQGATEEKVADALQSAGLEVEAPEVPVTDAEPQRDAFESDEAFNAAVDEWKTAHPAENETEDDGEGDGEGEHPARKPSKFVRRLQKITRPLEQKIADLEAKLAAKDGGKTEEAEAGDPNPRPVRAAYKTVEEYEDALIAWGTTRTMEQKTTKDIEADNLAQAQENYNEYKAGVDEFVEAHDDWEETVSRTDIPVHPDVQYAIFELREKGAAVTYYLGKHPDYAQKLANMPVRSAVMEVGRLSVKLSPESGSGGTASGGRETNKPRPRAPAPVRPVNTSATSQSSTSLEAAKNRDFKAFKRAQRAGR